MRTRSSRHSAKTGKFQTNEKIAIPKPKTSAADAYFDHTANAATADYGPEAAAALATLGIGGDGPNIWNADDQTLGNLWANNADLLHARLDAEQEQHPLASPLGELTGVAVDAPLGGVATDAAGLGKLGKAAVTTAESAAYGSGAAGPGNRGEGAVTGAALAAATEAAAPFVAKFVAATKAGNTAAAAAVAKAAHDLGIDLPRFVIGSTKDARKAAALEQSAVGSGTIIAATNKMIDQSEAARNSIAGHLGTAAATDAQLGDQALNAAVAQNRVSSHKRARALRPREGGDCRRDHCADQLASKLTPCSPKRTPRSAGRRSPPSCSATATTWRTLARSRSTRRAISARTCASSSGPTQALLLTRPTASSKPSWPA
jgi:hypothetical protein